MDPHRDLESRAFAGNWRVYQQQALDAFDADVAAGDNRAYLVLPPGAGKTMIGLEAARRLGAPEFGVGSQHGGAGAVGRRVG